MGSPGGYAVNPGLYRVPDLLTEDQFKEYMWQTYGARIEFVREEGEKAPSPARALGHSRVMGPAAEDDSNLENMNPPEIRDPILRDLNSRNYGPDYASTVVPEEEKTDEDDSDDGQGQLDLLMDESKGQASDTPAPKRTSSRSSTPKGK